MKVSVFCADIGSVARSRFGWAAQLADGTGRSGDSIDEFASVVAEELRNLRRVCLGFECPLFVPLPEKPRELTRARRGEGNRPWCAGAGASALATGLTEVTWILIRIRERVSKEPKVYFTWPEFLEGEPGLFIWEAFISRDKKGVSHIGDAKTAVHAFQSTLPDPMENNLVTEDRVFSLVGAALLRAGWKVSPTVIKQACLVLAG